MGFIWGLLAALALGVPSGAAAENPTLFATVGPGFAISLKNASGVAVKNLQPGTYTVQVDDRSEIHNFHLRGPGVDMGTDVEFIGKQTWTITLVAGKYTFRCDPHSDTLHGDFTVGAPPPPPPPRLVATVGPGLTISLRTAAGKVVRLLKARTYRITVRDRSRLHNFHLLGIGLNRRTTPAFVGTVTWTVRFVAGRTYRFRCDTHPTRLRGSFRASA